MYRKAHPLFLICNTPTHVGSGSDLGIVDLPIQRERHTGFPKFEGSSLKGSLREAFERAINSRKFSNADDPDTMIHRLFGYDEGSLSTDQKNALNRHFQKAKGKDKEQTSFAGAVGFSDARLLLFPVKSMKGVFAWITCPKVLQQFKKDMDLASLTGIPVPSDDGLVAKGNKITIQAGTQKKVLLEEYAFDVKEDEGLEELGQWLSDHIFQDADQYWKDKIKTDIVVIPDNDFKDFVNLSTEVITRTKIDNNTGTVAQGALFTEEYLPAESVMYALALTAAEFRAEPEEQEGGISPLDKDEVFSFFKTHLPDVIQIGGNATLGKGIIRSKLLNISNK